MHNTDVTYSAIISIGLAGSQILRHRLSQNGNVELHFTLLVTVLSTSRYARVLFSLFGTLKTDKFNAEFDRFHITEFSEGKPEVIKLILITTKYEAKKVIRTD